MLNIDILIENENLIVINKPAGMSIHGDGKSDQETVSDWVLEKYPELEDIGEQMEIEYVEDGQKFFKKIIRPGIVHRLDKDTTGCLVIAKTQEMYEHLKKQFKDHTIEKVYHAVVYGSIKDTFFSVDQALGRSRGDVRKWTTGKNARGTIRDAHTDFEVLSRLGVEDGKGSTEEGTFSYVQCMPTTGRTHQIRIHLKYMNHPIVGDTLYAARRSNALSFERLALHAQKLSFVLLDNTRISVEAPYPKDFQEARVAFGLPVC